MFRPATHFEAVTPHATNKLPGGKCRGVVVGVSGTVVAYNDEGTAVTVYCTAGFVMPIVTDRILDTSTATGITALY